MTLGIAGMIGLAGFALYMGSYLLLNLGRLPGDG
jgi:hypothetical protein